MLLIETRSPWESGDVADFVDVARSLLEAGVVVHLHLIQNGVYWLLRDSTLLKMLRRDFSDYLSISSDDFSLAQRGVSDAVATAYGDILGIDALVAEMADQAVKTIWHS